MKYRTILILLLLTLFTTFSSAKDIDGYVREEYSGKVISDARIEVEGTEIFTYTNDLGYFSLAVSGNNKKLKISAHGYNEMIRTIDSATGDHVEFLLIKSDYLIPERLQDEDLIPGALTNPVSGYIKVSRDVTRDLPVLGSEFDPVKSLQMLPGAEFGREGMGEIFVRGGGARQNLYNLNGIPVYGDNHGFGFLSVYNADEVNSIGFYRGAYPARYGGRLSSVVDITSNYGNKRESGGYAYASPMTIGVGINGPVGETGKSSFAVSARRSYLDILMLPYFSDVGLVAHFYDIQLNWEKKISDNTTLQFHSLYARDNYLLPLTFSDTGVSENWDFGWSYTTVVGGLNLNHAFTKKHFGSFAVGYSYYSPVNTLDISISDTSADANDPSSYDIRFYTGNFDIITSADMVYRKNRDNTIRYGAQITTHGFNTGRYDEVSQNRIGETVNDVKLGKRSPSIGLESAFYVEDELKINSNIYLNAGARAVLYAFDGFVSPQLEPRVMMAYRWNKTASLKLSYMRVNQFLHSLNNDGSSIYMNRWIPSTEQNKPGQSNQFNLAWVKHLKGSTDFHMEGYYKTFSNLYLEQDASSVSRWVDYSSSLYHGNGKAYGVEFFLQKLMGNFTGYASYGFSKATREFEKLNGKDVFPFNFDRRHNFKIGGRLVVDEEYTVTVNLVVGSGLPYTLPGSLYRDVNGQVILGYEKINNYRSNWYQRFDLGVIKSDYAWEEGGQKLTLSLYNMFATKNTTNVFFEKNSDSNELLYDAFKSVVFVFIPGIRYELIF